MVQCSGMDYKTAILILHFRDNAETVPCLDSLAGVTGSTFTPYILSVQSSDTERLRQHRLKPVVIDRNQNGGFAWANNLMMRRAVADGHRVLVLLNNDTTVDPHFLRPLVTGLADPQVGFVCPKIYFYPGKEFHHDAYSATERGKVIWYMGGVLDWANVRGFHWGVDEVDHGQFTGREATGSATGCCMALTKDTLGKIGYMDEKYFLYYEDADWSIRCRQHGLKILVEPESVIWHKNAGSTGGAGSDLQRYYQTRNRIYFGLKYAPLRTKAHLVLNAVRDAGQGDPVIRQASRDALLFRLNRQNIGMK